MADLKKAYELAKEQYAVIGVDVDKALEIVDQLPLSIHCWQGDDVGGMEGTGGELTPAVFRLPETILEKPGTSMSCVWTLRRLFL